jgi:multiple antibiotic resistance protein
MEIVSIAILLFIVIDPFGNIPFINSVWKTLDAKTFRRSVTRELLFALAILSAFLFFGTGILDLFQISEESISIAGGVILLIISVKMIFVGSEKIFETDPESEAFLVPIAVPSIAGPSAMTTCILLSSKSALPLALQWLALFGAWLAVAILLIGSRPVASFLGKKGLAAMDRLMGLLLVTIAVEMLKDGVVAVLREASVTSA